jgi:hypothetical protein
VRSSLILLDFTFEPNNGNVNLDMGTYVAFANATATIYKGNLTATKELIVEGRPPSVPQEIWFSLFGIVVGFLIPSGLGWINGYRQRRNLSRYRQKIDNASNIGDPAERTNTLKGLERDITEKLEKDRISESHFEILKKRIEDGFPNQ